MTKPVKFTLWQTYGFFIQDDEGMLLFGFGDYKGRSYTGLPITKSAAEARNIAAKINEWADAKEASERVTFGDLYALEWFEFTSNCHEAYIWYGAPDGPCQKLDDNFFYIERTAKTNKIPGNGIAVTRLRATFTPEEVKQ